MHLYTKLKFFAEEASIEPEYHVEISVFLATPNSSYIAGKLLILIPVKMPPLVLEVCSRA